MKANYTRRQYNRTSYYMTINYDSYGKQIELKDFGNPLDWKWTTT